MTELINFFVHSDCSCGSVLLLWRFNKLCSSSFVDDINFHTIGSTACHVNAYNFIKVLSRHNITIVH